MFRLMAQQLRQQVRQVSRASYANYINATASATSGSTPPREQQQQPQQASSIMVTKALEGWPEKLRKADVGDIDFNIKCLVAHVLGRKFNTVKDYNDLLFTNSQLEEFERLCEARCARMPLQYLIGEWDFMDLTLKTSPSVFIPRPETEEFVSKVIEAHRDINEPINMFEVGCGSGAISLAILNALPNVRSTAIDRGKAATELSRENAEMLGLDKRFTVYHHTMEKDNYVPPELVNETYDLIVGNPPYVKTEDFPLLQPEVVIYENLNALDGGPDGLRVARLVFNLACEHLRTGGKLWLELGEDHPPMVQTVLETQYEGRLRFIAGYKDQYKRNRFVEIEKVKPESDN
ncbi:MTRF1L release factor glutamine methyltransferase [Rhagoletis pomonella]|uniref:MTRF1L release factor glutamine methyltransferase n=1 Tax=Rhagoletis pomonella TaxID=28610 RepID=UPI0017862AA3|nr:MTRF1L release factor glutamine methyltransferase [Rhagoletis pomonella]